MKKALIVVDVQNDFLDHGSLEVKNSGSILTVVNQLICSDYFDRIIATQDYHPKNHISFAKSPEQQFQVKSVDYTDKGKGMIEQIQWPVHCVANTHGAAFHSSINTQRFDKIVQKGCDEHVDSYSGFFDNAKITDTGLNQYLLNELGQETELYIIGLALDFCVGFTATDAVNLGYKTMIVMDATKGVFIDPTGAKSSTDLEQETISMLTANGIDFIDSGEILS